MRHASIKPDILTTAFPPPKTAAEVNEQRAHVGHMPSIAKRRVVAAARDGDTEAEVDEFGDADINDLDLASVDNGGFANIEDFDQVIPPASRGKGKAKQQKPDEIATAPTEDWQPRQLDNGKWACNHQCKDKTACKHLCCREGLDKQPKPPKFKERAKQTEPATDPKQMKMTMSVRKESGPAASVRSAKTRPNESTGNKGAEGKEISNLNRLHASVSSQTRSVPLLGNTGPSCASNKSLRQPGQSRLSFAQAARKAEQGGGWSDYGETDELLDPDDLFDNVATGVMSVPGPPMGAQLDDSDDEMLDAGSAELSDGCVDIQPTSAAMRAGEDETPRGYAEDMTDEFDFDDMADAQLGPAREAAAVRTPFMEDSSNSAAAADPMLRPDQKRMPSQEEVEFTVKRPKVLSGNAGPRLGLKDMANNDITLTSSEYDAMNTTIPGPLGAPPLETKASSPDSLGKWFEEHFGTEDFNYVGPCQ